MVCLNVNYVLYPVTNTCNELYFTFIAIDAIMKTCRVFNTVKDTEVAPVR